MLFLYLYPSIYLAWVAWPTATLVDHTTTRTREISSASSKCKQAPISRANVFRHSICQEEALRAD